MHNTFGARLRRHRERQGVALATIAARTKIKTSLLEELERDDLSHWPAGIFRRAYVRSYALAIGLDADTIVREFLEQYPEPVEEPPPQPVATSRLRSFFRGKEAKEPTREPAKELPKEVPKQLAQEPAKEPDLDLLAAAHLCTELGRVERRDQVASLLHEAVRILDARGLVVWLWDAVTSELKPVLVDGYPDRIRAQLAGVRRDAANVTAAAFRTAQTCVVTGGEGGSAAVVVPMLTAAACAGVLAIELPRGAEQAPAVRAIATFIAAMLAQIVSVAPEVSSPAGT